jgi:hypothetical protein
LKDKLASFAKADFHVKDGEKSIHDSESIRFMKEVIGAGKWHENVLSHGLRLDFKKEPLQYREKNNVSALKQPSALEPTHCS